MPSLRDGLLHLISGLLTQWTTDGPSIPFVALFVFVAERCGHDADGVASLKLSLINDDGTALFTEAMSVDFRDSAVAKFVAWANVSASSRSVPTGLSSRKMMLSCPLRRSAW